MWNPNDDGITHLNVGLYAKTATGRLLSNQAYFPFKCDDGKFDCIDGLWYFLLTGDNRLRTMSGLEPKRLGDELRAVIDYYQFPVFKDKILHAISLKLKTLKKDPVFTSELSLAHYYVYNGEMYDSGWDWIIEYIEEYRDSVRAKVLRNTTKRKVVTA